MEVISEDLEISIPSKRKSEGKVPEMERRVQCLNIINKVNVSESLVEKWRVLGHWVKEKKAGTRLCSVLQTRIRNWILSPN